MRQDFEFAPRERLLEEIAHLRFAIDEMTGRPEPTEILPGEHLTPSDVRIFSALTAQRGKIVSREGLLTALCYDRPDCDWPDINIVDVRVCILRKKVSASIRTVHGEGYVIDRPADPLRHLANCQDRADDEGCGALIAALKRDDTAC